MLLCTVRNCTQFLDRLGERLVCAQGHSFDVARAGYINLLQPQDRRSSRPGDSPEAVAARRRLHDRGVTGPLARAIGDAVQPVPGEFVLDAGCGEGFYGGSLARAYSCRVSGVDISVSAINAAARRYPECEWVVANADRFLPWPAASFSILLSITGRMNPAEFRRVLRDDGRLLIALPSPMDLMELRGAGRDRCERTIEEFRAGFELLEQQRVTTVAELDARAVTDVLLAIYRPFRARPATATRLTFSLDLLLFQVRAGQQ